MRFQSVRNRIVTAILRPTKINSAILAGILLFATGSQAAWQDPLQSPSQETNRAHESLLLDIARIGSRLVAVGAHGNIVYSDDSGKSWQQGRTPSSVTLTSVYFSSSTHGWAVGHDGLILHTKDAGESWVKQFDGYLANEAMVNGAVVNKEQALKELVAAEESGELADIERAEMHLENATYALDDAKYDRDSGSTKPFLDVWFYDANTGFAVGAYGMTFHTVNGGETWVDWSSKLENDNRLHINGLAMVGPRSLMLVGEQGLVLRSDDMGYTWRSLPSPYDGSYFGIMAKNDDILVFGLRGNLFHSIDGGIEWERVDTKSEQTLMAGIAKNNKSIALVGNGGSVILLDQNSKAPKSIILKERTNLASAIEAQDGSLVLVGESGVERLTNSGEVIQERITMTKGGFSK